MKTTLLFVFIILQISYAQLQNAYIDSVYPHQNSSYFLPNGTVKVFFSQPMNASTIINDHVFVSGSLTGKYNAAILYQSATNSLEIQPTTNLKYGELISVTLDSLIQTDTGNNITPFVFTFNVKPKSGSLKFAVADSLQLDFPPTNIASADLNNDGYADVVVSNYDSLKVAVALNNGLGSFSVSSIISGLFKPKYCVLTDIDNDGDVDMLIPTYEQNEIQIYKNYGSGLFISYNGIDINTPVAICPGDFDGDGDIDMLVMTDSGFNYFLSNTGNGDFVLTSETNNSAPSIRNIVADIDNDGDLDIIGGTSDYWGVFKILVNDGNGNFTFTGGPYLGPYPDELAGGDFDGDYDLDFVKCDWYQNGIGIALNNGSGEFPVENFLNLGNVGGQSRNPVVNDFDGDGDLDFIVAFNSNNLGIVKNNGHPIHELYLSYQITGLKGITAADFDNNGSIDIAGISSTTNQIKFLKNCLDSLVAYFPFNGNANDESGNINNGVINNASFGIDRLGNNSSSGYFYGNWSFIEGTNAGNNLPIGNAPRTFNAWIKLYDNNESPDIFNYGSEQQGPYSMRLMTQNNLGLANGYNYGQLFGNTNLIDTTWHFVTGVYYGGSERITKLFVDGKLDTVGVLEFENNTILENRWRIGTKIVYSPTSRFYIDEVKVFDFALSDQQIWDTYKTTTTAPTLLFPLDDSTLINPIMLNLVLDWDSTVTATGYRFLLANDSLFNTVIHDTLVNTSSFDFYDWFSVNIDNLYWKVRTINDGGIGPWSETNRFNIILTDVEGETQLPTEFALMQNYPNPFNPSTRIKYSIGSKQFVQLKVYDVLGNEIATLVNEEKPAGSYEVEFQSTVGSHQLASGIYYYQLRAGEYLETKKMILMK